MYIRAVVLNTSMFGSLSNISPIVYEKGLYIYVCVRVYIYIYIYIYMYAKFIYNRGTYIPDSLYAINIYQNINDAWYMSASCKCYFSILFWP